VSDFTFVEAGLRLPLRSHFAFQALHLPLLEALRPALSEVVLELLPETAMGGVVGRIERVPRDLVPERFCGNLLYATLRKSPNCFPRTQASRHQPN